MEAKGRSNGEKTSEAFSEQVRFTVEPGTKLKITLDVGETIVDGKVPVTLHIEQIAGESTSVVEIAPGEPVPAYETVVPAVAPVRRGSALDVLRSRLGVYDLAT